MHWHLSHTGRVHVCGHRGHSIAAPENTLAALRANHAAGGTTAEIDTVLTADGEIVVIHDLTVDRTTDGTGVVADLALGEVRALDAGAWFGAGFAGERVPTLAEAIATARSLGMGLEVEVKEKRDLPRYGAALARVLSDPADRDAVMMISFDHVHLRDLKQAIPGLRTGGICHARYGDPVALARAAGLDQLCIDLSPFHPDDARALHAAGLAIRCHAYRPEVVAEADRAGLRWTDALRGWLAEGLIDTLSGDDVAWCAALVAQARG
jgi:glycerophosphoryl diester phosphodiesterase